MTPSDEKQRSEVYYQGRVQGVGFRYTALGVAAGYRVTGFVRNLPDGRVLLVAEGEAGELGRFLQAIDERLGGYIADAQSTVGDTTGVFDDFQIRY